MLKKISSLLLFIIFFLASCKKNENENSPNIPEPPSLNILIKYSAGNQSLVFDSIKYINSAGNNYSISTLMFYLSDLRLIKPDSQQLLVKEWIFVDAKSNKTNSLSIKNVPEGQYIGMVFNIGLDSTQNVPNGLPLTADNALMEWPVPMGGGYHFLKMEGHFLDSGITYGYALHLGRNISLCKVSIPGNFCVGYSCNSVILNVEANEWFQHPYTYDLNVDGNYIMGNDTAMLKIAQNGKDVFTLQ